MQADSILKSNPGARQPAIRRICPGLLLMLERKTVSIPRACELVGVSRRTIYNWIAANKIQYIRTAGGSVRIFADTLWREPEAVPVADPQAELPRVSRGA